jgi:hypothetical protein
MAPFSFTEDVIKALNHLLARLTEKPLPVIAKPTGRIRAFDHKTTTATFQTIVEITPSAGKQFNLAKIVASCLEDFEVQLFWENQPLTLIYKQMGKSVLIDWFPPDYGTSDLRPIIGNGDSKIELQGRYPTGGVAADLYGEIVGEEIENGSATKRRN